MQTRRILIVDDAPEFAHLVKDALATMQIPLQVTVYLSGEEAWLEALKTRFDLVITDLRLPGISGTELIRRIRQRFPKIKIIAVSGLAEAGLNERTRAAGVDAFYRKPVEIPLLLTKIDNLLTEIDQERDSSPGQQPEKAPMVSRLVTVPLALKPEMAEEIPPDSQKRIIKPSPEDLKTMHDLEQRLLKLMKECGAGGVALTTLTGSTVFKHGLADHFVFTAELINICSNLVASIKDISHQPDDSTSLGLLALNGNTTDLFISHVGGFLIWLLFPTGSQSTEAGKTAAALYDSRDNLKYILNMLALLPLPTNPHPPMTKNESQKEHKPVIEDADLAVTTKLSERQLKKEEVEAFWDVESEKNQEVSISADTISFDKAASMGLVKDESKNKKS